uniref:Uncharacterized protein n=2 Tax=Oryza TaxID=4527 RepID=Q6YYK4_ORYSJ|nr:hypothetical protein [Oryza sativa Japonica Group]
MAKLAAQLKDKFCGLIGRITSCGRAAHKDAAHRDKVKGTSTVCVRRVQAPYQLTATNYH